MESIFNKFPLWQPEIKRLYQEDADFQELCQDYEEVHALVATWTDSMEVDQDRVTEYQVLLKDLETEIMEYVHVRYLWADLPDQSANTQTNNIQDQDSDADA